MADSHLHQRKRVPEVAYVNQGRVMVADDPTEPCLVCEYVPREALELALSHLRQGEPGYARDVIESVLTGDVDVPRGAPGCTCGTPPFAPPEPANDCPFHGDGS